MYLCNFVLSFCVWSAPRKNFLRGAHVSDRECIVYNYIFPEPSLTLNPKN